MSSRRWTIALCVWTFVVWTTRIGNIWNDDALTTSEQWGRTALALSFTAFAIATVVGLRAAAPWLGRVVQAFAAWTIGVWVIRAIGIATGDHEAAFITVHVVLAVISIALAVQSVRETASSGDRAALTGRR